MSGVFGVVAAGRQPGLASLIERMAAALSHREWFVADRYVDETHAAGLGRVGIGVFNPQAQPVVSEDGGVMVVMSGELDRAAPLRRTLEASGHRLRDDSDAELALHLYRARGTRFVDEVEGAFVLAIWDRGRRELIIANDRYGLYPLIYAHVGGKLLFAPEMKAIFCDHGVPKQLDLTALAEYVRFQFLLGDRTFFEHLKLLRPATLLRYQPAHDRLALESYWDFARLPALPATLCFREAAEEAGRLLRDAVRRLVAGCHRPGVFLSGGLDARAILGMIPRSVSLATVTFGVRHCRDEVYARRMAAAAGARHHYFEFADGRWVLRFADLHLTLTEGFHSWIHAHGISILDEVRRLMDVNLSGFGGGQSAVDWEDPWLFGAPDDRAFACRLFGLLCRRTTWPSITEAEERALYAEATFKEVRGRAHDSLQVELARYAHLPCYLRAAYFALCNPDRRLFQYYTVFNRSHVEQRFPFYDYRYAAFVYALPPDMLYGRRLRRAIIVEHMPALARVPYDRDDLPITATATRWRRLGRRVRSYVGRRLGIRLGASHHPLHSDYERWLRHELRPWGEELLLGERSLARGMFRPEFVRSLWARHQSGTEAHTIGKLAPLMSYEMLLRRFCD